ncbi:MAG: 5-formyltetrahydrofolate cyclo-ligase [Haloplasmataceae bacterium]|nr:5-formyltetrahydrofolate cyclo-ligase [Haloplasmataceae bacterium]
MKKALREQYLNIRNQLDSKEIRLNSNLIIENVKKQFDLNQYNCFAFYMPLGKEVNIKPLIEELLNKNKKIVLPKVLDKTTMEFFPITDLSDVHLSKFKILEPNNNQKMPKNDIDLMFIPGIAFNHAKYRLGFGAGFYDRYLSDYKNIKVGICYEFQVIKDNFADDFDIPMNLIITENHVHQYHDEDLN